MTINKPQSLWARSLGAAGFGWQRFRVGVHNLRRRLLRRKGSDWPMLMLTGGLNERAPQQPWYMNWLPGSAPPLSLQGLSRALRAIAGDPETKGVLIFCRDLSLSLAKAQSLAALLARFSEWDRHYHAAAGRPAKQIRIYLEAVALPTYVAFCAAGQLVIPPGGDWEVKGFFAAPVFWKESLARIGVEFEVIKVAPWKTAADSLTESGLTEGSRDQFNWLYDSLYGETVAAIAAGRGLEPALVRQLIDRAPLTPEEALAAGLIDQIGYEDEFLAGLFPVDEPDDTRPPLKVREPKPYGRVQKLLYRRPQRRAAHAVGVISLQGTIMPGTSRSFPVPLPLLGDETIGSTTAQQVIRAAREDDGLRAVIVHVDSPGGSALASDLIWRELRLLDAEKPVIIYMGDVAASGGYYIAAGGRHIVAQRSTITGSIGVILARPVTQGFYEKLGARRERIQRGDHAGLYSDMARWDAGERQRMEENVDRLYRLFRRRVCDARLLSDERLLELAGGRVWTGEQAHTHGLVDELGDFRTAIAAACRLAHLPDDGSVPIRPVEHERHLVARPAKPAATLAEMIRLGEQLAAGEALYLLEQRVPFV